MTEEQSISEKSIKCISSSSQEGNLNNGSNNQLESTNQYNQLNSLEKLNNLSDREPIRRSSRSHKKRNYDQMIKSI